MHATTLPLCLLLGCATGAAEQAGDPVGSDFVFLSEWIEQECDPIESLPWADFTVPEGAIYQAEGFGYLEETGDTWQDLQGYRSADVVSVPCYGERARLRYVAAR